ncbi:MAG: proline/glycine betaine ABC transporter permease [Syntrophomonadaceae bacterium]|nr:proline/glycine betaine ABC transporter permease [Syntrophomonadaceae bacterium]MDD3888874.1 proline/glycine betaine ABC transporter permease [Syntrophomonadaceae bacterium]MDD4549014.1 proline/glycine betaine ABC transporter permease [Syntrophomonadaceae bacterium]
MFPDTCRFHIAPYIQDFVEWLNFICGPTFNAFSDSLRIMLINLEHLLLAIPWWLWIIVVTLLAWRMTRHPWKTITPGILIFTIGLFGLWEIAIETLAIVIISVILSLIVGVPSGIAMAVSDRVETVFTPVLDAMQTMPSFVYLIPAMMFFELGKVPAVVATFIYAVPPVQRLTNLGIRQVSTSIQEAAVAFGATSWQLMREVRIPLALPSILAGINQTTMMALSMVVICSMVGAGGLGEEVIIALNRIDVGRGFEAGWAIVVLAIIIDRLSQGVAQKWHIKSN